MAFFYDPFTQLSRHLLHITAVERQFVSNLLIRYTLLLDSGGLGSNVVREVQCLFKATEKEGLQGGKGDNNAGGRPRHIHDPGIQQEPP